MHAKFSDKFRQFFSISFGFFSPLRRPSNVHVQGVRVKDWIDFVQLICVKYFFQIVIEEQNMQNKFPAINNNIFLLIKMVFYLLLNDKSRSVWSKNVRTRRKLVSIFMRMRDVTLRNCIETFIWQTCLLSSADELLPQFIIQFTPIQQKRNNIIARPQSV